MYKKSTLSAFLVFLFVLGTLFVSAGFCADKDAIHIRIDESNIRKIPMAVPDFYLMSPADQVLTASIQARDLLEKSLYYTGFFKILPRASYLGSIRTSVNRLKNFNDWTAIGAELLVAGAVKKKGPNVVMQLALWDTYAGKMLVGKQYTTYKGNVRTPVLMFCSEIMKQLTGKPGIFETRVAFVSTTSGNKEIWTCDFDGTDPQQITRGSDIALSPAWSSDGRYLAYTSYKTKKPKIFVYDHKLRTYWQAQGEGLNCSPAWIPGEFAFCATLNDGDNPDIYTLTGKGKITNRLTTDRGIDVSPSWSPDGKHMAFVSDRGRQPQIYIRDTETGKVRRLTFSGKYNTDPAWSPTGRYIAYTGKQNGRFQIYIIDVQGRNNRVLTREGDNESPTWSPDGTLIAFSSTREGPSRIYVMGAGGQDQRRLVMLPGQQSQPSWSPYLGSK